MPKSRLFIPFIAITLISLSTQAYSVEDARCRQMLQEPLEEQIERIVDFAASDSDSFFLCTARLYCDASVATDKHQRLAAISILNWIHDSIESTFENPLSEEAKVQLRGYMGKRIKTAIKNATDRHLEEDRQAQMSQMLNDQIQSLLEQDILPSFQEAILAHADRNHLRPLIEIAAISLQFIYLKKLLSPGEFARNLRSGIKGNSIFQEVINKFSSHLKYEGFDSSLILKSTIPLGDDANNSYLLCMSWLALKIIN